MALRLSILAVVLLLLAPAAAQAQLPADVARVEAAVTELSRSKTAAGPQIAEQRRAAERALQRCRRGGRGWKRIRAVRDRAQRNAYTRGAKELWTKLREVAREGAALEVYTPFFERYFARFDVPLADPVLQAALDAQRRRFAYNKAAYLFGSCRTFEQLLKKVREFKIGGSHGVSGDYQAGRIHNVFVGYVAKRQRAAARKHWGSRYDAAIDAGSQRLKDLGGNEGRANYFVFAQSIGF
jgi:hypothetical protein